MTDRPLISCDCTYADKCPQGKIGTGERCRIPAPATICPIPMLLNCPSCGERHIDQGEFATKPHHTHACQGCGMVWRPAKALTVGVQFLPGFKDTLIATIEPA